MRSLYKRISTNLLMLILGQLLFYIFCLILVIFLHHSKDSKKRLKKAVIEVVEAHKSESFDMLDHKFEFLFDRNLNNYSYLVKNSRNETIRLLHVKENPIEEALKEGFHFTLNSYKDWIFTLVVSENDHLYAVQTRHEVDIIDDFMWSLLFTFPILIFLNYKLCKRVSASVVDPLSNINIASEAVRRGHLSSRIPEVTHDKDVYITIKNLNGCFTSLESNFKKLNQFSVDVAHELKNPLASALASMQIAISRERDTEYYKTSIKSAVADLKQIQKIVDSILILHQDETKLKEHFGQVNFAEVILDSMGKFKDLVSDKEIAVKLDLDPNVILNANQDLLIITINNLLQNAFKFSETKGAVEITLNPDKFMIRNFGEAIPPDLLDKVFDAFMKAEQSRSTEGYGIGLSIVKWICELHHFKINISSSEENGTMVSIYFK